MWYHVHDGVNSLMVTGFTVIVLHTLISPYYNILHEATVSMETKQCTNNLTCYCTTHQGTRPVCEISDCTIYSF